ncbi:MAG: SDR family NAD(P)-dependent oxidoreductase, partial [Candidatus Latescibacteria bacterium]|nr:SDR family NAD(P)-dependent oxidoreductase [Candidatus Latescibacterota bacterium]
MKAADPNLLAGQVAWVTASARGLGRAIAERLARCGAAIAVHSRSDQTAAEFGEAPSTRHVAEQLQSLGAAVTTVFADIADPDQAREAAAAVERELGPIDILVNNAGGDIGARGRPNPNDATGISDEDIQAVLDRNLMTTLHTSRAISPRMVERGRGRIVNIGSVDAFLAQTHGAVYAAAKAAQAHYTRCLAGQLRP